MFLTDTGWDSVIRWGDHERNAKIWPFRSCSAAVDSTQKWRTSFVSSRVLQASSCCGSVFNYQWKGDGNSPEFNKVYRLRETGMCSDDSEEYNCCSVRSWFLLEVSIYLNPNPFFMCVNGFNEPIWILNALNFSPARSLLITFGCLMQSDNHIGRPGILLGLAVTIFHIILYNFVLVWSIAKTVHGRWLCGPDDAVIQSFDVSLG